MHKDGGVEFSYTKVTGEAGEYDMVVDAAVKKILRSKKLTSEIYDMIVR